MKTKNSFVAMLLCAIGILSCDDSWHDSDRMQKSSFVAGDEILVKGKVHYTELEGGFYYIAAEDGQNYDPINLDDEYKIPGLDVAFIAIVRTDLASFHMFGILIEIVRSARDKP